MASVLQVDHIPLLTRGVPFNSIEQRARDLSYQHPEFLEECVQYNLPIRDAYLKVARFTWQGFSFDDAKEKTVAFYDTARWFSIGSGILVLSGTLFACSLMFRDTRGIYKWIPPALGASLLSLTALACRKAYHAQQLYQRPLQRTTV